MTDWSARAAAYFGNHARTLHLLNPHNPPIEPISGVSEVGVEGSFAESVIPQDRAANEDEAAAASIWLLRFADRCDMQVTFSPPVDHCGVLAAYPEAIATEPVGDPSAVPVPADLAAMLDACLEVGLYSDDDRAALPAMLALDTEGTRGLIEAMHARIGRCRRCLHFHRPGLSDGYCARRDDLGRVYGRMHRLPADGGVDCGQFATEPGG